MIAIYGAGDDLVEVEGYRAIGEPSDEDTEGTKCGRGVVSESNDDELSCHDARIEFTIGHPEATAGKNAEGVRVWLRYGDLGVWSAEIFQIEEGIPIPWEVRVKHQERSGVGYSVRVEVDAPNGTPVRWAKVQR